LDSFNFFLLILSKKNNFVKDGQLGDGTQTNISQPKLLMNERIRDIQLGQHHSLILTEEGDLLAFGSNKDGQGKKL
jgi:alpha-tubulin suppressor-like RCC1 family protein